MVRTAEIIVASVAEDICVRHAFLHRSATSVALHVYALSAGVHEHKHTPMTYEHA